MQGARPPQYIFVLLVPDQIHRLLHCPSICVKKANDLCVTRTRTQRARVYPLTGPKFTPLGRRLEHFSEY